MTHQFGRRAPKTLTTRIDMVEHEKYIKLQEKADAETDRMCAWAAYFTLVFAAITSFIPETAAAAIIKVAMIAS